MLIDGQLANVPATFQSRLSRLVAVKVCAQQFHRQARENGVSTSLPDRAEHPHSQKYTVCVYIDPISIFTGPILPLSSGVKTEKQPERSTDT